MRSSRLLLVVMLSLLVATALAGDALAVRFADTPCPEAGPGGIRTCPAATVGIRYAIRLTGAGGCGPALPYQFRLLNGSPPPGLSLGADGELSGTPTYAGNWRFWIEMSDQNPPSAAWCVPKKTEREFIVRVGAPAATVGTPYSLHVGAAGTGAQTWSIVGGALPPGLLLDPGSGAVAGTPTSSGSFLVKFSAVDTLGRTAAVDLVLTVNPLFAFVTSHFSEMRVGRFFRSKLATQGAVGAVRFVVVSGRFPIGVRLERKAGIILGTPRKAGRYRFTIRAQDGLERTIRRSFVLRVSQR